ncbi:MAG: DUF4249 domain-containing protein [bacterium]|nr:DUF4249 domain-containing protein [bacterium]
MKSTLNIWILFCLIAFSACQRVATVKVPQTDPLPVMFSFLSPESEGSAVTLTMSVPIFGSNSYGNFDPIANAQVTLSDNNGNSKVMPYSILNTAYYLDQTEFKINPGMTYTIEAKFKEYTLKGTTTIPLVMVPFEEVIGEKLASDPNGTERYFLKMKWKDQASIKNYYRVNLEDFKSSTPGDTNAFSVGDKMYSDEGKDGQILSDKYEYFDYSLSGGAPSFNAYLLNTDIHYYEYHKRRLNYYGDDPFSEPVQQYSNVKGGLGVVCSYRKSKSQVLL